MIWMNLLNGIKLFILRLQREQQKKREQQQKNNKYHLSWRIKESFILENSFEVNQNTKNKMKIVAKL